MSLEEIADSLQTEPGHGEERLHRAMRRLRETAVGAARVMWLHGRWRRDVSLLAAGALSGAEHAAVARPRRLLRGVSRPTSPRCARPCPGPLARRARFAAEPPIAVGGWRPRRRAPGCGRAVAAVALAGAVLGRRGWPPPLAVARASWLGHGGGPSGCPCAAGSAGRHRGAGDRRLRRGAGSHGADVARERTARYLDEAQDVLVNGGLGAARTASGPATQHVDLADEARAQPRAAGPRRASTCGSARPPSSAQPVLDDVEKVLREVASLRTARASATSRPSMPRGARRLLMKMRAHDAGARGMSARGPHARGFRLDRPVACSRADAVRARGAGAGGGAACGRPRRCSSTGSTPRPAQAWEAVRSSARGAEADTAALLDRALQREAWASTSARFREYGRSWPPARPTVRWPRKRAPAASASRPGSTRRGSANTSASSGRLSPTRAAPFATTPPSRLLASATTSARRRSRS